MKNISIMVSLILLAAASGCVNPGGTATTSQSAPYNSSSYSSAYGTVESVTRIEKRGGDGIGAGAVIGGVVGGVLGHQVGQGNGNTAATVGGALGGAYIGNKMQESREAPQVFYQLVIRMDGGGMQTLVQNDSSFQAGDRVEVRGEQVRHR